MLVDDDIRIKAEEIFLIVRYFLVFRKEGVRVEIFSIPIDRPPRSPLFPAQSGLEWPGFYATAASSESRRSLPDLADPSRFRRRPQQNFR
jgi:hypothetical protein